MSDPAAEAARRAVLFTGAGVGLCVQDMENAAREALKPIRERHVSQREFDYIKYEWVTRCRECRREWPCDTAKDAYATEDLERNGR